MKIFLVPVLILASGCAAFRPNPYKQTWERLHAIEGRGGSIADVSEILGEPPDRCEDIEDRPRFGMGCALTTNERSKPVIGWIAAGFPAQKVGIQIGETVMSINGVKITTCGEMGQVLRSNAQVGVPVEVVTDQRSFRLAAEAHPGKQCFWRVSSGTVSSFSGGSGWAYDPWSGGGGGGSSQGSSFERFISVNCRFIPTLFACSGNSQY